MNYCIMYLTTQNDDIKNTIFDLSLQYFLMYDCLYHPNNLDFGFNLHVNDSWLPGTFY